LSGNGLQTQDITNILSCQARKEIFEEFLNFLWNK